MVAVALVQIPTGIVVCLSCSERTRKFKYEGVSVFSSSFAGDRRIRDSIFVGKEMGDPAKSEMQRYE